MHRDGHLGAALLAFAPVGLTFSDAGALDLAVVGAAVAVALAMVPDYDQRVAFVTHRGVTHTLVFAVAFGLGAGAVAEFAGAAMGVSLSASLVVYGFEVVGLRTFGFFLGTLTMLSHLAADALTPAGVPLLWPLSGEHFSLGLVNADSLLANYGLLLAGAVATAGWVMTAMGTLG